MDTIRIGYVDYNIWYVDPSLNVGDDGLTPDTAFITLSDIPTASIPENALYLIRRTSTSYSAALPASSGTSTTANLIYMGMPLPTDPIYELLPEAVKTAWGGDTAEYANISLAADICATHSAKYNFMAHRCYFYRTGTVPCGNYMFSFSTDMRRYQNIKFTHCKFGCVNYDLSASGYSTVIPNNIMGKYVYTTFSNTFTLQNCVVHHGPVDNDRVGILYQALNSYIESNALHSTGHYMSGSAVISNNGYATTSGGYESDYCSFTNNTCKFYVNGATGAYCDRTPQFMYITKTHFVRAAYNTFTDSPTGLGGTFPATVDYSNAMLMCSRLKAFDIHHNTATMTVSCYINQGPCQVANRTNKSNGHDGDNSQRYGVFCFTGYLSATSSAYRKIHSITITLPDTPLVGSAGFSDGSLQSNFGYGSAFICAFTNSDTTGYTSCTTGDSAGDNYVYAECNASNPVVLSNINVSNGGGRAAMLIGIQILNSSFRGQVCLHNTIAEIDSLTSNMPGRLIWMDSTPTKCHITTLTANKANSSHPYTSQTGAVQIPASNWGNLVVDSSNIPLFVAASSTSAVTNRFFMISKNDVSSGNFRMVTANVNVVTSSVYRSGGASASLKFYNNYVSQNNEFLMLGGDQYSGLAVTPSATGLFYLYVYIAFKDLSFPARIAHNFQIVARIPTASGTYKHVSSLAHGRWLTDSASVWNNDSSLTQMLCRMPIDIETTDPISLEIMFNEYSATGYLYLDPIAVLSAS